MRLIDADAFEKFIKEKYKDGESTDDIKDQILFDLSYQPTAYDTEKVADCLEKASTLYSLSERDCEFAIRQDLALHIVRKGGIK